MNTDTPNGLHQHAPRFQTSDPEQISHYMSRTFRPNRSTLTRQRRYVDFTHRSLQLGSGSIHQVRYGGESRVEAPPIDDVFLAIFTLTGHALLDQGDGEFNAPAGSLCILNPTRQLRLQLSEDFEQLTVKLPSELLHRTLLESGASNLRQELSFNSRAYLLEQHTGSFTRLVRAICNDMSYNTSLLGQASVGPHLAQTLAGLLINEFGHNYSDVLADNAHSPTPALLRRAEEYMRAKLDQPLTTQQVAREAGCSVRTLQLAFRRFRHTTPGAWLRTLRLDEARQFLLRDADSMYSITDIAYRCGFNHLSKFAAHYRTRFGETPSQTRQHVVTRLR